jgi:hypothetical protein
MIGLEQSNRHNVCCISGSTPLYDDDDDDDDNDDDDDDDRYTVL